MPPSPVLSVRYSSHVGIAFQNPPTVRDGDDDDDDDATYVGAVVKTIVDNGAVAIPSVHSLKFADGGGGGEGGEGRRRGAGVEEDEVGEEGSSIELGRGSVHEFVKEGDVLVDVDGHPVDEAILLSHVIELLAGMCVWAYRVV